MTRTPTATATGEDLPEGPIIPQPPKRVMLADLIHDTAFTPRTATNKHHVHDLARRLHVEGDLDPIKVWPNPATGRLIILDGRQRVAAYRFWEIESIPAAIFTGSRKDARLEAARNNSKTENPWTTAECTNYAWGLVIEGEASKAEIMKNVRVGYGTIGRMRKRLAELKAAGKEPDGNWWKAQRDDTNTQKPKEETEEARQARLGKLKDWMNGVDTRHRQEFGQRPTMEELGTALRWHLGTPRFKAMVSGGFLADEDDLSEAVMQRPLATPHPDPSADF